ncbi:complex I NDUFA9 subunit family protein [Halovulum sp. GXIMD14793]
MTEKKLVTIFGGSGFVGRYIARRMARAGWRVRVAVRRPNEALFVRTYGSVGQVEPVLASLTHEGSVRAALSGADAVVISVGTLIERGKQSFTALHADGPGLVARVAAEMGVAKLIHVSAIGADAESDSAYARSKAEGEAAVTSACSDAVILRPSVIFGVEDEFFNRLANLARLCPILPITRGEARFQPVYVDDVAAAAEIAILQDTAPGIYELGGPEVDTLRNLIGRMLKVIQRSRVVISLPVWIMRVKAFFFEIGDKLTGGLIPAMITRDQIRLLHYDNVVADEARGLEALGITPTAMDEVLEGYLYCYRPHGQYDAITASAKNLR